MPRQAAQRPSLSVPFKTGADPMTLRVKIVLPLLVGGGGGYFAHRTYGLPRPGGVFGLIPTLPLVLRLFSGLPLGRLLA